MAQNQHPTEMQSTSATHRPIHYLHLTLFAVTVCLILFFIDEGRYSLTGLLTTSNIVAMSLYLAGLLMGLFTMNHLLAKRAPGAGRTITVLLLGSVIGIAATILFIFAMHCGSLPK